MTAAAPILRLALPPDFLTLSRPAQAAALAPFLAELEGALAALPADVAFGLGWDFARLADLSVGVLLALEAGLARREVLTVELRGVPGEEQAHVAGRILEACGRRLLGAAFDATGPGWALAEAMGRRFGLGEGEGPGGPVRAVRLSEDWYRRHMPPLKAALEDGTLALAPDAEHLADLRAIRLVRGIPRVPDLRAGAPGLRRHGDFAVALALAHWATRTRPAEYAYLPVTAEAAAPPGRLADTPPQDPPAADPWSPLAGARLSAL